MLYSCYNGSTGTGFSFNTPLFAADPPLPGMPVQGFFDRSPWFANAVSIFLQAWQVTALSSWTSNYFGHFWISAMDAASFAPHFAHSPSVSLRVVSQGHSIQPRWLSLLGRNFVVAHIACGKTFPSVHFAIWRSTNLLLRLSGQSQHSAQMALMQRVRARRVAMHGNCDRMWLALLGSRQIFSEDILCSVGGAFLVRPVLGRSYSYQHAETKELINLLIVIITQIPSSDNVLIWITSTRSINLLRASTSYTSSPSKTLKPIKRIKSIKPIKSIKSIKPFELSLWEKHIKPFQSLPMFGPRFLWHFYGDFGSIFRRRVSFDLRGRTGLVPQAQPCTECTNVTFEALCHAKGQNMRN